MEILNIKQWQIPFELRVHRRARRLTLKMEIERERVVMVVPPWTAKLQVNAFLKSQEAWIEVQWSKWQDLKAKRPVLEHSEAYYKTKAKVVIRERLQHFNQFYEHAYHRVSFRNQKTRWGSCSSEGNLNFNWRLILAPLEILDYVVVHELCHLKHLDHSSAFWGLVAQQIPDYKERRKWLKDNHYLLNF